MATDKTLYQEAVERFSSLLGQAAKLELVEPMAMSLATVGANGRPSVRTVLLKTFDVRGFVFYTNKHSRKGRQIGETRRAALCFFWQPLMQQVLVEGKLEDIADSEADAYWATRPRDSQIGAWASSQSELLPSRETLEQRFAEYTERYKNKPVARPPHWSGYRLVPELIEFWHSRPGRLHERDRYYFENGAWRHSLIYP